MIEKPRKDIPLELTQELEDLADFMPQLTGDGILEALKRAKAREDDDANGKNKEGSTQHD